MVEVSRKIEKVADLMLGRGDSDLAVASELTSKTVSPEALPSENALFLSEPAVSLSLDLAGLSPPNVFDPSQAELVQELHEDAFHIPDILAPELRPDALAGTVISVGVFNAAFLPLLPITSLRHPFADNDRAKPKGLSEPQTEEVLAFFAGLGVSRKLLDRVKRFAKNQARVLFWLSGLIKTVARVVHVLREDTHAEKIVYEDEAVETTGDKERRPAKKRRILKI